MPNSRLLLSAAAYVAGIALIWMLISLHVIEQLDLRHMDGIEFSYFVLVFVFYVYYWIYFYNRPRGSVVVVDGRAALSASALIVGGTVGYALVDLGILMPWRTAGVGQGHFPYFIAITLSPLGIWAALFLWTLRQKRGAGRNTFNL